MTNPRTYNRRLVALAAIAVVTFAGLVLAQLSRVALASGQILNVGAVAPRDIRAPRQLTFVSEVETNRQRDLAQAAVAPIYTPPDAQIARRQLAAARDALDKISQIRADVISRKEISATDAITQMTSLPALGLTPGTASLILKLSDLRWAQIDASAISLVDGADARPDSSRQRRQRKGAAARADQPELYARRSRAHRLAGFAVDCAQHQL